MEQELTSLLRDLAGELGTTTEYLWQVLIKQANIQSIKSLIWILITCSIVTTSLFVFYRTANKRMKFLKGENRNYNEEIDSWWAAKVIVTIIVMSITIMITNHNISVFIDATYNPEYWVLETILEKLDQ